MARTPSRPSSYASTGSETPTSRYGSGRWANCNKESGIRFKICLCGMIDVGKTSIFNRLQNEDFTEQKPSTAFSTFEYYDKDDRTKEYSVWDTNGFEGRNSYTLSDHYKNAHCILLVYDTSNIKTLEYLEDEIQMILREQFSPSARFILVRNKIDLLEEEMIKQQKTFIEESKYLRKRTNLCWETSAKTNEGIKELFHECLPNFLVLPNDETDYPLENGSLSENHSESSNGEDNIKHSIKESKIRKKLKRKKGKKNCKQM